MTGTALDTIKEARKSLGTEERPPGSNDNYIVQWYNQYVARIGKGPWCDMSVTMWGAKAGAASVVGRFAYTVWHAEWFQKRGQWHAGTGGIRAGDIVFFDWGGTQQISRIDHVGIVERVESGKIHTIEGNYQNICQRVVRDSKYIAGYGRPAYATPPIVAPAGSPILREGSTGDRVRMLQRAMNKAISTHLNADGEFGPKTETAVKQLQRYVRFTGKSVDGEYGPRTAAKLKELLSR